MKFVYCFLIILDLLTWPVYRKPELLIDRFLEALYFPKADGYENEATRLFEREQ